jgi:hypothetical protein
MIQIHHNPIKSIPFVFLLINQDVLRLSLKPACAIGLGRHRTWARLGRAEAEGKTTLQGSEMGEPSGRREKLKTGAGESGRAGMILNLSSVDLLDPVLTADSIVGDLVFQSTTHYPLDIQ